MIFMKNRDNQFFDQQKLDELVKNRDLDTLRDQMVRILACPCCLNGFKHCRKYLKVFSVEEIQQTPYLATAAALICAIYGDLKQAEEFCQYVEQIPLMKLHLDIIILGSIGKSHRKEGLKRVLFIAEMNEIVKNMNEAMLPYFQVQLCIADAGMAGQLLHIFQPDIVLIFLSRLSRADVMGLNILLRENANLPTVVVGSMYEFQTYGLNIYLLMIIHCCCAA